MLNDDKPSEYLNAVYNDLMFRQFPFDMLYKLKKTEQSKCTIPRERLNHTMLVVDEAAQAKQKAVILPFLCGALCMTSESPYHSDSKGQDYGL